MRFFLNAGTGQTYKQALIAPEGKNINGVLADGKIIPQSVLLRYGKPVFNLSQPAPAQKTIKEKAVYAGILFNHYGHFVLESLSRAWYFKSRPQLPLAWVPVVLTDELKEWQKEILDILGIKNKIIFVNQPTAFEKLVVPEAGFSIPGNVFLKEQMKTLAAVKNVPLDKEKKVWLSRSSLKNGLGSILNERGLEAILKNQGWIIYHPEQHSVREQLTTMAAAGRLAGIDGSAFHSLLFLKDYRGKIDIFARSPKIVKTLGVTAKKKQFNQTGHEEIPLIQSYRKDEQNERLIFSLWPDYNEILSRLDIPADAARGPDTERKGASEMINQLIKQFGCRRYLEIGVEKGATFKNIKSKHRTGVDPFFRFNFAKIIDKNTRCLEMTSDQFFCGVAGKEPFDLIFIDGLHHFEQMLRDFQNSFFHSHPKTIWVIDDTFPSDPYSCHRQREKAYTLRKKYSQENQQWHGDVYKLVFFLHDFMPGISYRTVMDQGNPRTVAWLETRCDFRPRFSSMTEICRLEYLSFLENEDLLFKASLEETAEKIGTYFNSSAAKKPKGSHQLL